MKIILPGRITREGKTRACVVDRSRRVTSVDVKEEVKSWCAWFSGTDESWEATRPQGCSPLLVFVNSKSGDNQGVRFLRRFKQLLNPAQVFDLMNGGPVLG